MHLRRLHACSRRSRWPKSSSRIAPAGLTRCFFADNGSAAVEVAVKMSFHFWRNIGKPRKTRFITLANSYHGETLGALAVGNVELYKSIYRPLLMDVITVPSPDCLRARAGRELGAHSAPDVRAHGSGARASTHDEVAAVIVEPLVQCAGGMRMYDPVYLKLLREACDRHGVHLIADEIAVGFGRTGTMFACEQAGIRPDYLCLSKGLTGGYLPLSAVLTTETVYDAFYDEYMKLNAFLHSHSYTGNPLACAAALATLAIFRDQDAVLERNRALARHIGEALAPLADHPHVAEVRQRGMILAIELVKDRARASATTGASGAACASTSTRWRGRAAAPARQRDLLHAAVRDHAGGDRLAGRRRPGRAGRGMRLTRVHVEAALAPGSRVRFGGTAAAHVTRVLRLEAGDAVTLFNGDGGDYPSRLVSFGRDSVEAAVDRKRPGPHRIAARDHAGAGHRARRAHGSHRAEGDRARRRASCRSATARSVVKLDATAASESSSTGAASPSRPASSAGVPGSRRSPFREPSRSCWPNHLRSKRGCCSRRARSSRSGLLRAARPPIEMLVGPEGGLADGERQAAIDAGFRACRLGPRVLRTETAAIAALAVLQAVQGISARPPERRGRLSQLGKVSVPFAF